MARPSRGERGESILDNKKNIAVKITDMEICNNVPYSVLGISRMGVQKAVIRGSELKGDQVSLG